MSLDTWKEEFYPVPAKDLVDAKLYQSDKEHDLTLINHALKKWQGVVEENLVKHEVVFRHGLVHKYNDYDNFLRFDTESCSLCQVYYSENDGNEYCPNCPIVKVTKETCIPAYRKAREARNIEPMLDILSDVKESYEKLTPRSVEE
jgi:regulator of replication initiation timing